jgi:molybdopterin/thiamine biosynthesis adenylyltransferase
MKNQRPISRNSTLKPKLPKNCSIKVIGLGGVGGIVARYLSVFIAAQQQDARMVFIDGDKFEPSNATRMLFGRYGNKAVVTHQELKPRFKHTKLTLETVKSYVKPENIKQLIRPGDVVFLCVDNHATRKLVDEHCETLRNVCLISGGNDGVGKDATGRVHRGTYGNVQVHLRSNGKSLTHTLSSLHPEIRNPADKMPHELNCTDLVVSTPQILFANMATASALLNASLLYFCGLLHYSEVSFDIADALMRPSVPLKKI